MANTKSYEQTKLPTIWAVVVSPLVEKLLPTQEACGSNLVTSKYDIEHLFSVNCIEKTKIKKKTAGMAHLKKHLKQFQNQLQSLNGIRGFINPGFKKIEKHIRNTINIYINQPHQNKGFAS